MRDDELAYAANGDTANEGMAFQDLEAFPD